MFAFDVALALIVVTVFWFIVKAVRQTRGQISHHLRGADPHRRDEIARDLATRMREQVDRVTCPRCGGSTFMLLGTENQYKCESCASIFGGPRHLRDSEP